MKVKVAKICGFCNGVKRAVNLAFEFEGSAWMYGPIIHNEIVIDILEKRGIKVLNDLTTIKEGTVIVRAHGIVKEDRALLEKRNINIVDGTCPLVSRVYDIALEFEKEGYHIIVFGEENHPEVKGIVSYLKNPTVLLKVSEKINFDRVAIVAQTTQNVKDFESFVEGIKKIVPDVKFENTICNATDERQKNAIELANEVDCCVVIGGKSSGNTKRLFEICSEKIKSYHIQSKDDLDVEMFDGCETVGVTAGASTPQQIIDDVVKKIEGF